MPGREPRGARRKQKAGRDTLVAWLGEAAQGQHILGAECVWKGAGNRNHGPASYCLIHQRSGPHGQDGAKAIPVVALGSVGILC